jgi:hypothetical protein
VRWLRHATFDSSDSLLTIVDIFLLLLIVMDLSRQMTDGLPVIRVQGDTDHSNGHVLREILFAHVNRGQFRLPLDMSECAHIGLFDVVGPHYEPGFGMFRDLQTASMSLARSNVKEVDTAPRTKRSTRKELVR